MRWYSKGTNEKVLKVKTFGVQCNYVSAPRRIGFPNVPSDTATVNEIESGTFRFIFFRKRVSIPTFTHGGGYRYLSRSTAAPPGRNEIRPQKLKTKLRVLHSLGEDASQITALSLTPVKFRQLESYSMRRQDVGCAGMITKSYRLVVIKVLNVLLFFAYTM